MRPLKGILLFGLFIFWATDLSSGLYYVLFFVILFLFLCSSGTKKILFFKKTDYIAISFILVWIYGLIVGFLRGNNTNYVAANFAGMICYLLYFILTRVNIKMELLTKVLLFSGFIVCFISVYKLFSFIFGFSLPLLSSILSSDVGISSTGQFRIYFPTLTVAYSLLGISLYTFLFPSRDYDLFSLNHRLISLFFLVLSIISLFFVSSSKGFMLGGIFITILIPMIIYTRGVVNLKLNKSFLLLLFFFVTIVISLLYFDYFSIFEMMFNRDDVANQDRYDQLGYIVNDFSFFGKGLGATVPGIVRSEDTPYGFELTYINLIHKFGIFSLILFFNWIYMATILIKFIYIKKSVHYSVVALSSMGYMLPSIGNPLLMHPSLVILNCLSLYYIRKIDNE